MLHYKVGGLDICKENRKMKKYLLIASLALMTTSVLGINDAEVRNKENQKLEIASKLPKKVGLDTMRSFFARGIDLKEDTRKAVLQNIIYNKNTDKLRFLFKYNAISKANLKKMHLDKDLKEWYKKQYKSFSKQHQILMETIKNKNATKDEMNRILEDWGEVNAYVNGQPLLIYAIYQNNEYVVDWLLSQSDVNVNVEYKSGDNVIVTPLGVAIEHGYILIVQKLLDHSGIDVNCVKRIKDGFNDNMSVVSALAEASTNRQYSILQILLNHKTNKYSDLDKYSALLDALIFKKYKAADVLIQHNKEDYKKESVKKELRECFENTAPEMINAMNEMVDFLFNNVKSTDEEKIQIMQDFGKSGNLIGMRAALDVNEYSEEDLKNAWMLFIKNHGIEHEKRLSEILIKDKQQVDETRKKWAYSVIWNIDIWDKHFDFIKSILEIKDQNGKKLVDINNIDGRSTTYLMILMYPKNRAVIEKVFKGRYNELVERIVNLGCNLNQRDFEGRTALFLAIGFDYLEFAEALLNQQGIDATLADDKNQTPLMLAMYKGYEEVAKKILKLVPADKKKDYVNAKNSSYNATALFYAIQSNNKEMVELLLNAGADINEKTRFDNTPLMMAAEDGYKGIVKLLLQEGADISIKNEHGNTALDIVKNREHREEIIQLLKEKEREKIGKKESPEQLKSPTDQSDLSVEEVNSRFKEAFEKSLRNGEEFSDENQKDPVDEMNQMLLHRNENGDLLIIEKSINEAFLKTVKEGNIEVFDLLLPYVKDLNVRDNKGNTALILSVEAGHDMFVSILLNLYGAVNINAENKEGKTALMIAVDKKNKSIIRELQNCGAKVSDSYTKSKYNNEIYGREAIKSLLEEKIQDYQDKIILIQGSFPVYAGNEFCKQLAELEGDPNLKKLADKAKDMIQKLNENPYYKASDSDENPEAWNFGCYSRRLNDEHRFIYRVIRGVVQCLFCKEHNIKLKRSDKKDICNRSCKYRWGQDEKGEYGFILLNYEDRGTLDGIANDQRSSAEKYKKV